MLHALRYQHKRDRGHERSRTHRGERVRDGLPGRELLDPARKGQAAPEKDGQSGKKRVDATDHERIGVGSRGCEELAEHEGHHGTRSTIEPIRDDERPVFSGMRIKADVYA